MSIADDLRAAAKVIDEHVKIYATKSRSHIERLRDHADTIERVEKEMREHKPGCLCGGLHILELADAPAIIRELLAENERLHACVSEWIKQNGPGGWIDDLRAREALRDAGPSPFQGRTTRRDEDDDKEYNFMMSHYKGRN